MRMSLENPQEMSSKMTMVGANKNPGEIGLDLFWISTDDRCSRVDLCLNSDLLFSKMGNCQCGTSSWLLVIVMEFFVGYLSVC